VSKCAKALIGHIKGHAESEFISLEGLAAKLSGRQDPLVLIRLPLGSISGTLDAISNLDFASEKIELRSSLHLLVGPAMYFVARGSAEDLIHFTAELSRRHEVSVSVQILDSQVAEDNDKINFSIYPKVKQGDLLKADPRTAFKDEIQGLREDGNTGYAVYDHQITDALYFYSARKLDAVTGSDSLMQKANLKKIIIPSGLSLGEFLKAQKKLLISDQPLIFRFQDYYITNGAGSEALHLLNGEVVPSLSRSSVPVDRGLLDLLEKHFSVAPAKPVPIIELALLSEVALPPLTEQPSPAPSEALKAAEPAQMQINAPEASPTLEPVTSDALLGLATYYNRSPHALNALKSISPTAQPAVNEPMKIAEKNAADRVPKDKPIVPQSLLPQTVGRASNTAGKGLSVAQPTLFDEDLWSILERLDQKITLLENNPAKYIAELNASELLRRDVRLTNLFRSEVKPLLILLEENMQLRAEASNDAELMNPLLEEEKSLNVRLAEMQSEVIDQLQPGDEAAQAVIVEIGPESGQTYEGEEVKAIRNMYVNLAKLMGAKVEIIDESLDVRGSKGLKHVVIRLQGAKRILSLLKFERGTHRLIKFTRKGSMEVTHYLEVMVYPELKESATVGIKDSDLEIQTTRSGGPGGQHVNTTNSAVIVRHKPSKLVVRVETTRSQHFNLKIAKGMLAGKLSELTRRDSRDRILLSRTEKEPLASGKLYVRTYDFRSKDVARDRILEGDELNNILKEKLERSAINELKKLAE
jgi:peptide chain release factor 1